MADVVDPATRSRMMSGIRSKHTRPELFIRRELHQAGFRFRLHVRHLPGSPDLVLPRYRAVIFVHGCFWHRHSGCKYATSPSSRPDFWRTKLEDNRRRDERHRRELLDAGWRVFTIWECGIRHAPERLLEQLIAELHASGTGARELPARPPRPQEHDGSIGQHAPPEILD